MPKPGSEERGRSGRDAGKREGASSIPQYISVILDELQRLVIEEDSSKQRSLTKKLKERLGHLQAIASERSLTKEQTRRDILRLLDPKGNWEHTSPSFRGNLLKENGVQKWLEYEHKTDTELVGSVESKVSDIETENQMLKEALHRRDDLRYQLEKQQQGPGDTTGRLRGDEKPEDRIKMLEAIVKKQDNELLILRKQITEENSKFVHIKKAEYQDIERKIKPCVRKIDLPEMIGFLQSRNQGKIVKDPAMYISMSDSLQENVTILIEYVDKMRMRVDQTADWVKEIEKDKEVCLQLLNHRIRKDDEIRMPLNQVLLDRLNDWKEEKKDYEREIKSLGQRIEELAREKQELMEALEKATAVTEEKVIKPGTRKISAPAMKTSRPGSVREKHPEEKGAPQALVVQAKVFNLGGCDPGTGSPSVNRRGLKKSVSVPNGPMRPTYK